MDWTHRRLPLSSLNERQPVISMQARIYYCIAPKPPFTFHLQGTVLANSWTKVR